MKRVDRHDDAVAGLALDAAHVNCDMQHADLADDAATRATVEAVQALAAPAADVLVVSEDDPASVEAVRALLAPGTTTVLIGRSGVGKSSLVNLVSRLYDVDSGSVCVGGKDVRDYDMEALRLCVYRRTVQ